MLCSTLIARQLVGQGSTTQIDSILWIAALVCLFGGVDDLIRISPIGKLAGLSVAALLLVASGVSIEFVTLPGIGRVEFGWFAIPADDPSGCSPPRTPSISSTA